MIHKIIYKLGIWKRNPSIPRIYKELLESDKWTIEQLEANQFEKLKKLLQFAYDYSDYYHKVFDEVGFTPSSMTSINDIKSLPIIDKKTLIEENERIHTNYKFKHSNRLSETSGTTGASLRFLRNEEWDSSARAALFRGYSWYGVKPWEKNGFFWGYNIDPKKRFIVRIQDWLQNRFRIFSYNQDEIRTFAKKLSKNTKFIGGYSSMIYETAKVVNKLGISGDINLKLIRGTSEKIYETYQEEVQKAFGQRIRSQYGSAESGCIAMECPCGKMHVVMENVYVEELDGEIVVTNLYSYSFPIIRYKLGDAIKLAPSSYKCECGRAHPVIEDVLGRVGKSIIGKKQSFPSLTLYYVFKNIGLNKDVMLNYQCVQEKEGEAVLNIEQNMPEYLPLVETEIKKYFGDDVDFVINWGQKLHKMDGKMKDFISKIA